MNTRGFCFHANGEPCPMCSDPGTDTPSDPTGNGPQVPAAGVSVRGPAYTIEVAGAERVAQAVREARGAALLHGVARGDFDP